MESLFDVQPYSLEILKKIITDSAQKCAQQGRVAQKQHIQYLDGYFRDLGIQTIVIEKVYTDRYYLEDYAEYYVRCFQGYKKVCTRLHFFSSTISREQLENLILGKSSTLSKPHLQEAYNGFIVVKPLPQTVIGRTCLKVYPENSHRFYPITRTYKVNLFGIPLQVENTLAFQEQDRVVAACATSALWSALHGTGKLFHHPIFSPVQITKLATNGLQLANRAFPNQGLSSEAMAHAIRAASLEPAYEGISDLYWLKCVAYAYLKARIPLILGEKIYNNALALTHGDNSPAHFEGRHAVTVTGYNLKTGSPDDAPEMYRDFGSFHVKANRIDKIYVHDDQVGPFSKMIFDGQSFYIRNQTNNEPIKIKESVLTGWVNEHGQKTCRSVPELLLIPLYHKIRISYATIHELVAKFNYFMNIIFETLEINIQPEWDIFLSESNDAKLEYFDSQLNEKARSYWLINSLPKYIWRAKALRDESCILELVFDATDVDQGELFIGAVNHDEKLHNILTSTSKMEEARTAIDESPARCIFSWYRSNTL